MGVHRESEVLAIAPNRENVRPETPRPSAFLRISSSDDTVSYVSVYESVTFDTRCVRQFVKES
jgi:hypothetical protein